MSDGLPLSLTSLKIDAFCECVDTGVSKAAGLSGPESRETECPHG